MLIPKGGVLPSVSVLIPTFARTAILREALCSTESQMYQGQIEVIVLNDQPRQTLSIANAGCPKNYTVRVVNMTTIYPSLGAKRDAMLALATNAWVAFLDDDDLWMPWHLINLFLGTLGKEPVSAVLPKQQYRHQLGTWSYEDVPGGINGMAVRTGVARSIGFDHTLDVGEDNAFRTELLRRVAPQNIHRPGAPSFVYRPTAPVMHISRSLRGTTVDRTLFLRNAENRLDEGIEPEGEVEIDPEWNEDYIETLRARFPETIPGEHRRRA